MFFKNIRDKLSGEGKKAKRQQDIEDEFNKGNIVLPTGLIDYENYEEFKEKTSQLKTIQKKLIVIEKNVK